MKVEYVKVEPNIWYWVFCDVSGHLYTRRRDAVRGFERFCAAIRGMK